MPQLHPDQLKAQVTRWRRRRDWESERIFAVRSDFPYEGGTEIDCDGFLLDVVNCRSDLEARERLLKLEQEESGHGLLLVVQTDEERLGEDVLAWFAGRSLLSLDQREVLKEIYQASAIDPQISNDGKLLEALILAGATSGGRNAPGGVLDLDFAWSVILRQPDLMNQRPDLVEILRWSLDESRWSLVRALDTSLVTSFFQWVGERAGGVARHLETLFTTNQTNLYLPLGLVAGDLFHERLEQAEDAKGARVRLENYLNGKTLSSPEAATWSRAAREVLEKRSPEERERVAGEVDVILEGIRALELAQAFAFSKRGFRDRWHQFADDIDRLGKRKWENGARAVFNSLCQLREHGLASLHESRLRRAEMAARLACYESKSLPDQKVPDGLVARARAFASNDSFVDWARFSLSWGDSLSEVTQVYHRLVRRRTAHRIEAQSSFGERLRQWHAENEGGRAGFVPIESAMEDCVAPLAEERPVLVLVMDGMNFPAFHQLSESLAASGWAAQRKVGEDFPTRVLSVLPSITTVSRWALFAGKVQKDERRTEEVAFREHPTLKDLPGRGKPILFTKKDLGSEDSVALSSKVRDAIAGSDYRVVSVVINAIDDQLKTNGQLSLDWTIHGIGILPALLEAATEGNRVVVMTSDHGHIPEMESTRAIETGSEGEARYRYGKVGDESEREFTGQRIESATGGRPVILPLTESVRYGQKAGGYHGGASDLEALVPLAIFTAPSDEIEGYGAVDLARPEWWNWRSMLLGEGVAKPVEVVPRQPKAAKKTKVDSVDDLPLFGGGLITKSATSWIEALYESEVFAEQERLLGRAAPNREHMRQVIAALDANKDSLMIPALAQTIGQPSFRMKGMLSSIARFLNIEGYEVLAVDGDSDTVRLNRKILASQFQIET